MISSEEDDDLGLKSRGLACLSAMIDDDNERILISIWAPIFTELRILE